jgi:MFS family permease
VSSRRDFRLLWFGQAVSQLGSRTYGVAYMLWVLAVTGSPTVLGLAASTTLAAFALAQLPAGWLVDRYDRRLVMILTDIAAAVAGLSFAFAAWVGWFALWHLLIGVAVLGVCWAVRPPAEMAAIPNVVPEPELPDAMALVQARAYAAGLAGPLLAGVLFAVAPWAPFLLDGVSYLVALGCTAAVRTPLSAGAGARSAMLEDVRDGLRVFWRQRFVRVTAGLSALAAVAIGGVGLTVILMLRDAPSWTTGAVLGAGSAVGLLGAVSIGRLRRHLQERRVLVAAPTVAAVALLALPGSTCVVLIGLVYAAIFLLQPAWDAAVTTRWLTLIDDEYRGRVQSAAGLVMAVPMAATPVIVGALLDAAGPALTCYVLAATMATVLVGAAALTRAGVAEGDRYTRAGTTPP